MKTKHPLIPNPLQIVHFNTPLSSLFAPEHLKRLTLAALPKPNCMELTYVTDSASEGSTPTTFTYLSGHETVFVSYMTRNFPTY